MGQQEQEYGNIINSGCCGNVTWWARRNRNRETLLTVGAVGMSRDGPAETGIWKHY